MLDRQSWQVRKQAALQQAKACDPDSAVEILVASHRENPKDFDVLRALAVASARSGRLPESVAYGRDLVRLYPGAALSHRTLAGVLRRSGQFEQAEGGLRTALELNSQQPATWYQLGDLLQCYKPGAEVEVCYRRALALEPGNPDYHFALAGCLQALGRANEALRSYHSAAAARPDSTLFLNALGSAYYLGKNYEAAAGFFRQVLSIDPCHIEACLNLANVNYDRCDYAKAAVRYQQVLDRDPGIAQAWLGLGISHQELDRPLEALACFRKLLELEPDKADTYVRYGELCLELGRHEEALEGFERAAILDAEDARIAIKIGMALQHLGRLEQAMAHYGDMDSRGLGAQVDTLSARASAYERLGEHESAWRYISESLRAWGVSPRTAVAAARICHKVGKCQQVVEMLEQLLSDQGCSEVDRRALCFSLGAVHDRLGEYDAAFRAYAAGNALKQVSYSEEKDAQFVDRVIKSFSGTDLKMPQIARRHGPTPVFIVGMPRSGTSLTEQILSSHPSVHGGGESLALGRLVERIGELSGTGGTYPEVISRLSNEALRSIADEYLDELGAGASSATHVSDKMPHNFAYVGLIRLVFPGAPIIHCSRDPLDTCLSCFFQDFSGFHNYAYDLEHLGGHYTQYLRLMDFWRDKLGPAMLELPYEELVAKPRERVEALLRYCGLDWDDGCLKFYESERSVLTASYDQVRQPIYTSSCGRWRNYRSHLEPLIDRFGLGGDVLAGGE